VQDAIDRQLVAIERIVATLGPAKVDDAERGARTLASLTRTLRELTRLRPAGTNTREGGDDDPDIRDLEEFRRELSRRLDQLVAEAKEVCPDSPEGS